jgi:hypothetical protein
MLLSACRQLKPLLSTTNNILWVTSQWTSLETLFDAPPSLWVSCPTSTITEKFSWASAPFGDMKRKPTSFLEHHGQLKFPLDTPQGWNNMLVRVSLQGWNPMTTTFCYNQFFRFVYVIKWLENLMLLSCKFVKSCPSYFAQRSMTRQHMKTWKLVISIRYAYLRRCPPQLFQSNDTFGYSFD